MAITNAQYDNLYRRYEQLQQQHQHELNAKKNTIYAQIPEYKEIENTLSSLCVSIGKKMLLGDETILSTLKDEIATLKEKKAALLCEHNFPADYLKPSFKCNLCEDTGYVDNQKCACFKHAITMFLYEQSNMKDVLEKENFSTLSDRFYEGDDLTRFQLAVNKSHKFVEDFNLDYQNLFIYGTVGTGKSFLSNCIAKELLDKGYQVLYFSAISLFDLISKNSFDYKVKEDLSNIYQDIFNCDLLIIDDLGTELTNSFTSSILFNIINERHLRKKSTLISSNLSLEEISDRYSERTFSRLISNYEILKFSGKDIRMYNKRSTNRK